MTTESTEPLEIFYSYDVKDEELRGELEKHLVIMQRQKLIRGWNQRQINAGMETAKESMKHLNAAHIILLLVSPDYLASDYCYDTEVRRAMERHDAGEAKVLPILLRPVIYEGTPFEKLSPLPSDGVPVKEWSNLDKAFNNVAQGIRKVIHEFKPATTGVSESRTTKDSSSTNTPVTPVTPVTVVTLAPPWNIPYRRNPFFTGRETLLKRLRENLTTNKATALTQAQAIHGLGGIGKTQTAVEYAYRYRDEYRAILWVSAASRDVLLAGFVELATLLNLPEKDEQNQQRVVLAVKRWLEEHNGWLLILDNADELALVEDVLPTGGKGHILLTTRSQAAGALANGIEVQELNQQEGIFALIAASQGARP